MIIYMNLKIIKMSEKLHNYVQEKFKKKEFYWDSDTIKYFKNRNKPGCEGQYYREVLEFVKNDCDLEDGETYEMLANDLMNQTKR